MSDEQTPALQRIKKTGLALVHEGEWIVADESSVAPLAAIGGTIVNYHFPVVVEVIGAGKKEIVEQICDELRTHFESLIV